MYDKARDKISARYGSINKLAKIIGIEAGDLYAAFKGTKPMHPKYKRLISEALGESEESLFKVYKSTEFTQGGLQMRKYYKLNLKKIQGMALNKGLSLSSMCDIAGISRSRMTDWQKHMVTPKTVYLIASVLETTPAEIIVEEE